MNRFLAAIMACAASFVVADSTVVSIDSNKVANVDNIKIPAATVTDVRTSRVRLGDPLVVSESGVTYTTTNNNRKIYINWPTDYSYDYTNYPGVDNDYVDPLVTAWFVKRSVSGLRAELSVFGDKEFYTRYTNSPPTNIVSLLGYVSNCVYLLSNVEVQQSYNSVSNEIEELKTRVKRTELTADHFGGGVSDLDYIISSNIEDMDAEVMLDMIKTLAAYIKNGSTNVVSRTESQEDTTP